MAYFLAPPAHESPPQLPVPVRAHLAKCSSQASTGGAADLDNIIIMIMIIIIIIIIVTLIINIEPTCTDMRSL